MGNTLHVHARSQLNHVLRLAAATTLVALAGVASANAATTTSNMGVQLVLTSNCTIGSVASMDFGSTNNLSSSLAATANISVTCTSGTPYTVELNAGNGVGATTATRKMTNGANTLDYAIYKEVAHTNVFGTGATDGISATGTAVAQVYTGYGLVPTQAVPPIGTYTDSVTVTVTY